MADNIMEGQDGAKAPSKKPKCQTTDKTKSQHPDAVVDG